MQDEFKIVKESHNLVEMKALDFVDKNVSEQILYLTQQQKQIIVKY